MRQTVISNGVCWILLLTVTSQITPQTQFRVTFKTSIPSYCHTQLLSHLQVHAFPFFTLFFCYLLFQTFRFQLFSHLDPIIVTQGIFSSNITRLFFKLQNFVSLFEESNLILDLLKPK